jgi:hypothetical protein
MLSGKPGGGGISDHDWARDWVDLIRLVAKRRGLEEVAVKVSGFDNDRVGEAGRKKSEDPDRREGVQNEVPTTDPRPTRNRTKRVKRAGETGTLQQETTGEWVNMNASWRRDQDGECDLDSLHAASRLFFWNRRVRRRIMGAPEDHAAGWGKASSSQSIHSWPWVKDWSVLVHRGSSCWTRTGLQRGNARADVASPMHCASPP